LVGISVTSLALYNFVRYDQEFSQDESIVILDVGAENTDLVIYKGDTLWIRNLGLSGNDITRAFMKKFRVSFEEAESLKCQVAESRQADKIFKVIEGSLAELSSDVQRSLGFYKSQNEGAVFQNVVVAGNTFKLPGLTQYMADRLGYAIISLVELEKIKVDASLDRQQFLEDLQSLGVSIGLAMQGLGAAQANINLLPKDLRIQSMLKTKMWAMVAVLILIAVAKFLSYTAASKNLNTVQDEIIKMAKVRTAIERDINETGTKMNDLAKAVAPLTIYRGYGLHRGFLHCVSSQTMGVFNDLAIQPLVYKDPPKPALPHKEGGDPALQSVYIQTLTINEQRANVGQTVFLPSQPAAGPNGKPESRELLVQALIPQNTLMPQNTLDSNKIREKLKDELSNLKVSREYFQVIDPLEQNADAPQLFESVVTTKESESKTIDWFYIDRYKTDAKGNILSEGERFMRKSVPAISIELKCIINPQILRTVR
jgi:Tfp pilus assembly PilM family ATPase